MNGTAAPSLWNLTANPVFQRYAVSRLRPTRLVTWLVLSQLLTGFFWALGILSYLRIETPDENWPRIGTPEFKVLLDSKRELAFLMGWFVVLTIQGLLVILKGTFSVATGVAREAHEGMMEGIDLTPLSPSRKTVGQLLGLPLLENFMAISLIPWAILSAILGGLSFIMMGKVYLLFATSALFHHAIGLVAGTLIRQKIFAGTLSQLCVLLLHVVLPWLGSLGVGVISHLGMESAVLSITVQETPLFDQLCQDSKIYHGFATVKFFGFEFGVAGYHWLITTSSFGILLYVLLRRWHDRESQILGKIGTTLVAAWVLIITCGESIPQLPDLMQMEINGRSAFALEITNSGGSLKTPALIAGFGMVIGILNLIFVSLLIPSLSRRLCSGKERWWGDGREALPWIFGISAMSVSAWFLITHSIRQIDATDVVTFDTSVIYQFAGSVMIPAAAWYSLVLWQGWKRALGIGFILGVLPLMVVTIGILGSASPSGWPNWLAATSSLVMPGYAAMGSLLPKLSGESEMNSAFWISATLHMVAAYFMFQAAHRKLRVG